MEGKVKVSWVPICHLLLIASAVILWAGVAEAATSDESGGGSNKNNVQGANGK